VLFHEVTIRIGSIASRRTHDSATLLPATVENFRDLVQRHGVEFRGPLPVKGLEHIELALARAGSAAMATFWAGGAPVISSALAPGINPGDDRKALEGLQSLILCLFGDPPAEPGFDLLTIPDRPLLTTVPIAALPNPDRAIITDAATCLAAAFFLSVLGGP